MAFAVQTCSAINICCKLVHQPSKKDRSFTYGAERVTKPLAEQRPIVASKRKQTE